MYSSESKRSFFRLFFLFFVFEVIIGGSGRVFEFAGGITLRKINFPIALIISFLLIFYFEKIRKDVAFIFIAYTCLLALNTAIGIANYGNDERIVENILYQSFFLLLPFYTLFIKNLRDIQAVVKIIKISAFIMAVAYLILLCLILFGVVDFFEVLAMTEDSPDFMARGESGFLFKGFLYLCLALFFFDNEKNLFGKRVKQIFIFIAVYFTFVRGFIVSLILTVFLHQLFFRSIVKSIVVMFAALFLITAFGEYYEASSFDRYESDLIRKQQLQQVLAAVTPVSFVIGHGFGEGVAIRDNHMEVTYLEIFHKQGIIGLIFWFSFLGYLILLYVQCKQLGYEKEARPFILASLFIYIQSATNPFLSNSIGLNMLMISMASMNTYINYGTEKQNSPTNVSSTFS